MQLENICLSREGAVAVVMLNRPERRNALSLDLMLELTRRLVRDANCVERHNSSGVDRSLGDILPRRLSGSKASTPLRHFCVCNPARQFGNIYWADRNPLLEAPTNPTYGATNQLNELYRIPWQPSHLGHC